MNTAAHEVTLQISIDARQGFIVQMYRVQLYSKITAHSAFTTSLDEHSKNCYFCLDPKISETE